MKNKLYVCIQRENEWVIVRDENKTTVFTKAFFAIPA